MPKKINNMSDKLLSSVSGQPDFSKEEEAVLDFWEKENIFKQSIESRNEGKNFVFFEGPPTANGKPGFHHIIARAFKDIIPRYKTMNGFRVERKAGWDTHGLPVELQVEKELGISGKGQIENIIEGDKVASIKKFNELCRESVWQYKEEWEKLTKRMGFWVDLDNPYITYEKDYIESVWWILKQAFDRELLYLDYKIVPYCTRCGTALSSHEVALGYKDVVDLSAYIKFKVKNSDNTYLVAWTTTPWTLPGNAALAIGADIEYGIYTNKDSGEKLILATERASKVFNLEEFDYSPISQGELLSLEYEPLFEVEGMASDKSYRIYEANFVNTGDGSGIVHIAPMYGEDDFKLGEEAQLPKVHTVDLQGNFFANVKKLAKEQANNPEMRKKILDLLKEQGLLLKIDNHKHTYPFCWRCDSPLIYYGKESWFIKMSSLRDELIARNETVKWVPDHLKEGRFGEWIREVKDWAISRDRYWGTPLPIWNCKDCGKNTCIGSVEELNSLATEELPADFDLHKPYIDGVKINCSCGGVGERFSEVIDVWLDSGAMPFAQYHYPFENKDLIDERELYPADYISEAIDQTRGWFYTLLAIATILDKPAPYKAVVVMAHILDKQGKKMSKSRGNIVDPWDVIDKFGIDPLRFYFYSVNQPGDTKKFDPKDLETVKRKVFLITWNIYSFLATNAAAKNWQPGENPECGTKNVLDIWLKARTEQLISSVSASLEDYDIFRASRAISSYIDELSTWYLRLSRKREDADFLPSLFWAIKKLALMMAPFAPFFAENLWQRLKLEGDADSIHLAYWPKIDAPDEKVLAEMSSVQEIVELGRRARQEVKIKLRQPLASAQIFGISLNEDLEKLIAEELNVKKVDSVAEGELKVVFDINITPELKMEGQVRELTRIIQEMRKKSGLKQGETKEIAISGEGSEALLAAWGKDLEKTTSTKIVDSLEASLEEEFEGIIVRI